MLFFLWACSSSPPAPPTPELPPLPTGERVPLDPERSKFYLHSEQHPAEGALFFSGATLVGIDVHAGDLRFRTSSLEMTSAPEAISVKMGGRYHMEAVFAAGDRGDQKSFPGALMCFASAGCETTLGFTSTAPADNTTVEIKLHTELPATHPFD